VFKVICGDEAMGGISQHNPSTDDHHVEKTETEARQSIMTGHMRYVLGISLALAVIAMVIIYAANF
jgi:hypothetical protein